MIPNPPIKRLRVTASNDWFCTAEDEVLTDNGVQIYGWDGTGMCFYTPTNGSYEMEDSSTVVISDGKTVVGLNEG